MTGERERSERETTTTVTALSDLTPELSRAAQWRKLCASVAQAQR